jgi:hypothetical protein
VKKGHLIDHCEADVLCDSTDHNAFRCPVHDEPKPVAQSVGYAVDALGAYYIEHPLCWVNLNPGLSHIEFGSPSCDSVAALIGGAPHFPWVVGPVTPRYKYHAITHTEARRCRW